MNKSEEIKNISAALVKFNSEISSISKDKTNPFYHSEYVTLDKLIISTRDLLQKNGLSVMQFPLTIENQIGVQTILLHESGEFIESEPLFMTPAKINDPQAAGSIISYLRRYSYQAILNLNTGEDDDGNKATYPDKTKAPASTGEKVYKCKACGKEVQEKVAKFSYGKFKKVLCMNCQVKESGNK